jgi:hypothetical protein
MDDNSHNHGIVNADIHSYYEESILIELNEHLVTGRGDPRRVKPSLASVSRQGEAKPC